MVRGRSSSLLKISIITVSYNSASTIRYTIESVLNQGYDNIEYIVIDGNSTDGTKDVIGSYGSRITKFISEPDSGMYDAMNKGIALASGSIIGILNSDDIYHSASILSTVMAAFHEPLIDCIFGDLIYFRSDPNRTVRLYRGKYFKKSRVPMGILPPHPTFFVRKAVYDRFGVFDLSFRYAADFDLMARFLYVNNITYKYLPITMVRMRLGGISTQNLRTIVQINKEDLRSCRKNGIHTNFFWFHLKYFLKVFEIRSLCGLLRKRR
jgi:glycosyltransferase involved in cell wall biosynthesis